MWSTPFNPFTWDKSSERVTTHVANLDLRDGKENLIPLSGLSPGVTIFVPLNQATPHNTAKTSFAKLGVLKQHNVTVQHGQSVVDISIVPRDNRVTISYLQVSQLSEISPQKRPLKCVRVRGKWLHKENITCRGTTNVTISFNAFYPGNYLLDTEFSIRQNNTIKDEEDVENRDREHRIKIKEPPSKPEIENVNYMFTVSEASCLFWDVNESNWKPTGCKVSSSYHHFT